VRVGIFSVLLNVALALALMWPLAHGGLALASSCAATFNLLFLLRLLKRRLGSLGGRPLLGSLWKTGVGSGCLAVWCGLILWLWPESPSRLTDAGLLAVAITGGAILYAGVSALLRGEEGVALFSLVRRGKRSLP